MPEDYKRHINIIFDTVFPRKGISHEIADHAKEMLDQGKYKEAYNFFRDLAKEYNKRIDPRDPHKHKAESIRDTFLSTAESIREALAEYNNQITAR